MDAPVVALTNARVIDGTGAPAGPARRSSCSTASIEAIGPSASTPVPAGARILDLAGKSVIPGLVMVHEHFYYPTGPGVYGQLGQSFVRLYLAGGVTTIRTAGNLNGYMDITLKRRVEAGEVAGPAIDATMPYVNGPNQFVQMTTSQTEERSRRHVGYWADEGATSVKAYMQISRAALGTAIREAHARGMKVTGHLCSVTYAEAAALGIDNLEHGFFAATDFVADKVPDVCPGQGRGQQTIADLDPQGAPFQALVRTLVERRVAVTSTLTVFELNTPGRPLPPGLDVLVPQLREQYLQNRARVDGQHAVDLPAALPQGDGARARVRPRRRPAPRRHRPHRRRRRHSRLCEPPAARTAGRSGVHAARGDPDRHVERRALPRARRPRRHRSRRASRPTSSWSTAIRRRRSPTSGRWRWCSSRAWATTRRSWWPSVTGRVGLW